jgi:thiol-disulfide isomerase/thioredoxin
MIRIFVGKTVKTAWCFNSCSFLAWPFFNTRVSIAFPAMRNFYFIGLFTLLVPCLLPGQSFKVFDNFSELEERIKQTKSTTTLVINFWATWCSPCVKELPYFNELHRKYAGSDVEVILVSLDMKSRLDKTLVPFLKKNKLMPEVILLSDQDADAWIPLIYEDWEGTIPATVLVHGDQRELFQEQFESYAELETYIFNFLKKIGKPIPVSKGS